MVGPPKFGRRTGLLGPELGLAVGGIDGSPHRIPVLVGLGLARRGREEQQAERDDQRHDHHDHGQNHHEAASRRPGGTQEGGEVARPYRVSRIGAILRLHVAHRPRASLNSALGAMMAPPAGGCGRTMLQR